MLRCYGPTHTAPIGSYVLTEGEVPAISADCFGDLRDDRDRTRVRRSRLRVDNDAPRQALGLGIRRDELTIGGKPDVAVDLLLQRRELFVRAGPRSAGDNMQQDSRAL